MEESDVVDIGRAEGKQIGKVSHFFPRISVAVIEPSEVLKVGDRIRIIGKSNPNSEKPHVDFTQTVISMEIEHQKIQEAKPGDEIGLQVTEAVREGCKVFKI